MPRYRFPIVFFLAVVWFSLFQPWGGFADPDAFYHAKYAAIMYERGPLHEFPWLDLTAFAQPFSDHHFLFHVFLLPFISIFGMFRGTQIAAVVFAAGFIAVLDAAFRRLRFIYAWVWTISVAASAPMIVRLSFAKASPIALAWFVLGMFSVIVRNRALTFFAGAGFALSHGGWMILLGSQAAFAFGETFHRRYAEDAPWRKAWRAQSLPSFFLSAAGVAVGTVLHPNFPDNVEFLWNQVVRIGLGAPYGRVALGIEWFPPSAGEVVGWLGPFFFATAALLFCFFLAPLRPIDQERARRAIGLAYPVAALMALTFKSARMVEYLIPAFALWLGAIAGLMDVPLLRRRLSELGSDAPRSYGRRFRMILPFAAVALLIFVFGRGAWWSWRELQRGKRPFDDAATAMQAISRTAEPGDRVYHSHWDMFPELFAADDRLRYVAGMDPTFLLIARPELSDAYRDLCLGFVTSTAYEIIRDRFGSRYAIVAHARAPALADALERDPRFERLYAGEKYRAYQAK